jgi:hypothetical protein
MVELWLPGVIFNYKGTGGARGRNSYVRVGSRSRVSLFER